MKVSGKVPIVDLNQHITCKICKGYFVDATTIIECLHTFCRSCIVKYLESNKYCPVCDVQVHKTKPLLNIRPDKTLQDIVYKLVPRLYQNEMQRRRQFYDSHPEAKPSSLEQCGEASYQHLLTPEETICLTLRYHGCTSTPRYLRCPAAVTVNHLKKLICAKYDLTHNHRVEVLYNQDCLNSSLTLIDIAYIYLWKRKGPLELTYRIYECTAAKKPKLETGAVQTTPLTTTTTTTTSAAATNNNNWKEVQLRISENGEMSITGIQDGALSPSLLEIVNSDPKYKNEAVSVVESKPRAVVTSTGATKREPPGLKYIGKPVTSNASLVTKNAKIDDVPAVKPPEMAVQEKLRLEPEANVSGFATLSSGTTTTVFSTINKSKCSTKSDDAPAKVEKPAEVVKTDKEVIPKVNNSVDKGLKRKNDAVSEEEPAIKQPKPTILNHSIGLLNLSNNHPLKKHSKLNRNGESVKETPKNPTSEVQTAPVTITTITTGSKPVTTSFKTEVIFSKPNFINKNFTVPHSRPGTPILTSKPSILATKPSIMSPKTPLTYTAVKSPCYMPKTTYNPVINVPKPMTSGLKPDKSQSLPNLELKLPVTTVCVVKSTSGGSSFTTTKIDSKPGTTMSSQQQQIVNLNNKLGIKSKPSTPIGYKTLRDPPKSWNSQISKANINKPAADPKYSDLKNARPAKFFKMRNNMPRYLGNPASGVKPMYQVHVSPEKDKHQEAAKMEKSEIRKHSIVKIDPKTLKPISEKAPETTSLSNHSSTNQILPNHGPSNHTSQSYAAQTLSQSLALSTHADLKINTSSVSIFNPLKLQSSPKNDRKSPKSPHSPKLKSTGSPTGGKRDKVNLNFTPPNPFIPNLTSPTMSPNQFLYPAGPPGFPSYDPRMMAAYHSLWYGQRMGFPASPIPGLSLDLNQRKGFDLMPSPTSPKMGVLSGQAHGPQMSSKMSPTTSSNHPAVSRPHGLHPPVVKSSPPAKKPVKDAKSEKSLETTVEKLTQSRNKEMSGKSDVASAEKKQPKEVRPPVRDRVGPVEVPDGKNRPSSEKTPVVNSSPEKSRLEGSSTDSSSGKGKADVKSSSAKVDVKSSSAGKEKVDVGSSSAGEKCPSEVRLECEDKRQSVEKVDGSKKGCASEGGGEKSSLGASTNDSNNKPSDEVRAGGVK